MIPRALINRPQWVLWRTAKKIPYQLNGIEAKVNDSSTWASFEAVEARLLRGGYLGVGYMFAADDPFCGIDLDACRDPKTGRVEEWAREILLQFATYAEVSPSRSGVKLFCVGNSPFDTGKRCKVEGPAIGRKKPGIEIYDHDRYFAVTGLKLAGMPNEPIECQAQIDELCKTYWPVQVPRQPATTERAPRDVNQGDRLERARRYVAKLPPAISGSHGHDAAYRAACILILGFALTPNEAYRLFVEFNERCDPPWSEREIWHKLRSADKNSGARGSLLERTPSQPRELAPPPATCPPLEVA